MHTSHIICLSRYHHHLGLCPLHHCIHDTNRALLPSYIIGISITRLLIPTYLLMCPVNFLNQSPNMGVGVALIW